MFRFPENRINEGTIRRLRVERQAIHPVFAFHLLIFHFNGINGELRFISRQFLGEFVYANYVRRGVFRCFSLDL